MSLLDYNQARAWAPMIRNALVTGYMPPWGAHERHRGEFKDERYIDDAEKATLIAWIDGGVLEEIQTRQNKESQLAAAQRCRSLAGGSATPT